MRHASWLKPMGLYAPEGRDVATRTRTMRDVPLKRVAKPAKSKRGEWKRQNLALNGQRAVSTQTVTT
jgi:hypothetical protein